MLTDKDVVAAVARDKSFKLKDAGGLFLHVSAKGVRGAGTRSWRYKFRVGGKEKLLVIGRYPEVGLKAARLARDEAKIALAHERDPTLEARRVKLVGLGRAEETFEYYARAWHDAQKSRWKPVHTADVIGSMERDLFPLIGAFPITDIDERLLLAALKKVERRGAIETARLRQRAERVFRFAKAAGARNANPATDVKEAMAALPKKRRWPAITEIGRLRQMVRDVDVAGASPVTRLASRFLALTAQRPGMLLRLPWAEIEHVDWDRPDLASPEAVWHLPSERMKLEFDLREDDEWDHYVPLAPTAVDALRAARALTGGRPLVFPSAWDAHGPMSGNAIGYLYNRIGYKGVHVPHGWRERLLHRHERPCGAHAPGSGPAAHRPADHRPHAGPRPHRDE